MIKKEIVLNLSKNEAIAILSSLGLAKKTYGEDCGTYLSMEREYVELLMNKVRDCIEAS